MGWIWSDELAAALQGSPDLEVDVPSSWTAQPSAIAVGPREDLMSAGYRLLGVSATTSYVALRSQKPPLRVCDCDGGVEADEPTAEAPVM